jgi:hypothetical protein
LPIQHSAAYFLAAPSVPDEAREKAVEKAEAGEEITFAAAREIVAEARKKSCMADQFLSVPGPSGRWVTPRRQPLRGEECKRRSFTP